MFAQSTIRRLLSIQVAIIALLGTVLLGMGQEDPIRPLITFVAVVTAVYFVDLKGRFHLPRPIANLCALVALALSVLEFSDSSANRLLAIANLLVYLQVVIWFQKKDTRIYWQLIMLSQVQVVVAAVLNSSILFGALLVVYMFLALAAMSLMYLHRELERCLPACDEAAPADSPSDVLPASLVGERGWLWNSAPVRMAGSVSGDFVQSLTGRELWRRTLRISGLTMTFTLLTFFAIPRTQTSSWQTEATAARRVVGYTQKISLGKLGEVSQNPELVMQLKLFDKEGRSFALRDAPLLQGSVVTTYSTQRGRHEWSQPESTAASEDFESLQESTSRYVVRQQITLEPLDEPVVFSVFKPCQLRNSTDIVKYNTGLQQYVRTSHDKRETFDLGTTGIRERAQFAFNPVPRDGIDRRDLQQLLQMPEPDQGVDPLARLRATAARVLTEAKIPAENHLQAARTLEAFLQRNGGYRYSLQPPLRDPTKDPIDDFVSTNKEGHCEFFAGALVLMLRSQEIPARIIIGFKSDEWNSLGQFYQVRQLHAHAWVEAYLTPADLEAAEVNLEDAEGGAWVRLDPTATATATIGSTVSGMFSGVRQMRDYIENLWINYVVALNKEQQEKRIYEPLSMAWSILVDAITGSSRPDSWQQHLVKWVRRAARWFSGNWFSWRGGVAAMGLSACALAAWWVLRKFGRRLRATFARRLALRPGRWQSSVEFYRRLETLLAAQGLRRRAAETPREFATLVGGEMTESPQLRGAAPLPRQVVEAFYRVRFGQQTLDNHELEAVEHALRDLEASLRQPDR